MLGAIGIAGYLIYRVVSQRAAPVTRAPGAQALNSAQALLDSSIYNASMLRNQAFNDALIGQGNTPGIV